MVQTELQKSNVFIPKIAIRRITPDCQMRRITPVDAII